MSIAPTSHSTSPRYDRLHFAVGHSDLGEAAVVRDSLRARGIQRVADCSGADRLFNALDADIIDLIVFDADLLRDRFVEVMQMVRRKSRGLNPFTIIVATVDDTDSETVKQLVKAGVDDMIARPVTGQRLLQSVASLMEPRKPFIVSHDYVGPSRRLDARAGRPAGETMIRVPNTMRSRAVDNISEDEIQRMVETAVTSMRDKQLMACGTEIDTLARILADRYVSIQQVPERFEEARGILRRLESVADELRNRCRGTQFERIGDLATMTVALTQRITKAGPGQGKVEVQLVGKLAAAIMRALSVESDSVGVMQDIAETIASFTGMKH
jgi:DNA-binding response OmpR family regulator